MAYTQLMVDPPWPKRKGGIRSVRPKQSRSLDYLTMSVDDIFNLLDKDVLPRADPRGHNVFLWAVDQFLPDAEVRMYDRGYKRHARFVWNKLNGTAPAFTVRFTHEYLLWFYKPKLLPVSKDQRGKFGTVIDERSREHSRKPDAAYTLVDTLYPEGDRVDVFSRERRQGWDQWGDQLNHFSGSARP